MFSVLLYYNNIRFDCVISKLIENVTNSRAVNGSLRFYILVKIANYPLLYVVNEQ